jgi:hypothetical protein
MPRRAWTAAWLLVAAGTLSPASAQPLAPVGPSPGGVRLEVLPPAADEESAPVRRSVIPERPPSILEAPIASQRESVRRPVEPFPPSRPRDPLPANPGIPPALDYTTPVRAAGLGMPVPAGYSEAVPGSPIPASAVESRIKEVASTQPADPVNDFLSRRSDDTPDRAVRDLDRRRASGWRFGENLDGLFGERGEWFRSDHAFDGFISPVTNPFLFEDPRSLTELRPIFLSQKMPNGQADFRGGSLSYFGVQGRVAFTDRLSFVFNKLGGLWINPGSESPIESQAGFAELWFGPKFTFIRNEETGSLLAGGLQFQVPIGSQNVFQNTGTLSLVPYASYAQNLFRDFAAGSFNTVVSGGYSFSTTSARSDYLYLSGHIDMDVLNCHRFYPLFEMNYFLMTRNGTSTNIGSEGRDLINFGGQAAGKGLLTGAFGARFKVTENAQIGGAFEIPFVGPRDLFQYRFTLDFILRY